MIDILTDLTFGVAGLGQGHLDANWSAPEADFTWSIRNDSRLTLKPPPGLGNLILELDVQPLTAPPALPAQHVHVSVNGVSLGDHRLEGRQILLLDIPQACVTGGRPLRIRLQCPQAASPAHLGIGNDTRRLGVRLYRAVLLRAPITPSFLPAPGADHMELDWSFGWGGTGNPHLLEGWSGPEHNYVWSLGRHSELRLPIQYPQATYTLLLDIFPIPDARLAQRRIMVGANGRLLATLSVTTRIALALALPPMEAGTDNIAITFDNLDAALERDLATYHDGRPFAFMLLGLWLIRRADLTLPAPIARAPLPGPDTAAQAEALSGLPMPALTARFDTLGHGCTLADFQLKHGADRISLLRFTAIDTVALVHGLIDRFHLLGRPDRIETSQPDDDEHLWIHETTHRFRYRSPWRADDDIDLPFIAHQMSRRLWFLRSRFLEDLGEVGRIYVFFLQPATQPEAEAVAAALRLYGPHTVLWLVQDGSLPPGTVMRLGPGLLLGSMDQMPGSPAPSDACWHSVLANAWAITEEP
jgi:hypothetical protein